MSQSVKKIPAHFLLQYQSKSYYIIGRRFITVSDVFITLSGTYYIIGRFYYIIGWYRPLEVQTATAEERGVTPSTAGQDDGGGPQEAYNLRVPDKKGLSFRCVDRLQQGYGMSSE